MKRLKKMDSDSQRTSCRFSSENWKVLQDFREEKHKHELFEASIVSSQESLVQDLESSLSKKSEMTVASESPPTFKKRLQKILDGSHCNDSDEESVKLISPSQYISKDIDNVELDEDGSQSVLKVEKYCRKSLCVPKSEDTSQDKVSSQVIDIGTYTRDAPDGIETTSKEESTSKHEQPRYISPSMALMASILFRLPHLRVFVNDYLLEVSSAIKEQQEKYPTLNFFVDVAAHNIDSFTDRSSNSNDSIKEPMPLLLLSTLEIFHEELTQAKSEQVLKRTCVLECRYTQKKNHSIVSHLFRGHFTKKLTCACGYGRNVQQAFTDVPVLAQHFPSKTIIINYYGFNLKNVLKATKLLLSITNWTKVCDLSDILQTALKRTVMWKEDLKIVFFTFADNQHAKILDDNIKIYQLMSESSALHASDIRLGSHLQQTSMLSTNGGSAGKKIVSTSTPAVSETASSHGVFSSSETVSMITCKVSALVTVKLMWFEESCELNLALEFPKICNGLYVFERINRIVGLSQKDFSSVNVNIISKAGLCIFCLNKLCNGCQMQLNDRVLLSQYYVISVRFFHGEMPEVKEAIEDESITENSPITILTLNECLTCFAEREDSHCPTCFEKCDWKPSETFVKKFPDVLIVHFQSSLDATRWLHFPRQNFKPIIGKRKSKFNYNLVCLTTIDDDTCIYLYDNNCWTMKCDGVTQTVKDVPTVGVEMLVYLKDTENVPCTRSQCKINERIKRKKKMGSSTTYSTRNARLRKPYDVMGKAFVSEASSFMTDGTYTTLQHSDQESTCQCSKCHTLDKLHSQISHHSEDNMLWVHRIRGG